MNNLPNTKNIKLKNGNLIISPYDNNLKNLLSFSSRNNKNRKYIFLSKVLGKYIPTNITKMTDIFKKLAKQLPQDNIPTLIIGFAETATALGYGIFMNYKNKNSYYITTTRYNFKKERFSQFIEEHSHSKKHIIYKPNINTNNIQRVILIDDEITTGKTAINLLKNLQLPNIKEKILVSLITWNNSNLNYFDNIITLYKGKFTFIEKNNININKNIKSNPDNILYLDKKIKKQSERFGINKKQTKKELKKFDKLKIIKNNKILIIGNGEYMFFPYLIGKELKKKK